MRFTLVIGPMDMIIDVRFDLVKRNLQKIWILIADKSSTKMQYASIPSCTTHDCTLWSSTVLASVSSYCEPGSPGTLEAKELVNVVEIC